MSWDGWASGERTCLNRAFDSDMCVRTDNGAMSKTSPKGLSSEAVELLYLYYRMSLCDDWCKARLNLRRLQSADASRSFLLLLFTVGSELELVSLCHFINESLKRTFGRQVCLEHLEDHDVRQLDELHEECKCFGSSRGFSGGENSSGVATWRGRITLRPHAFD